MKSLFPQILSMHTARRTAWRILFPVLGAIGCGSDTVEPVDSDTANLFWRLELNRPAIMLSTYSPYDTVRVTATPLNVYGEPIQTTEPVSFAKLKEDDVSVSVTSDGLITARSTTSAASVIATMTINGVKRTAEAQVMVRNEWPVRKLREISLQPTLPDSGVYWALTRSAGSMSGKAWYADNNAAVASGAWKRWGLSRNPDMFDIQNNGHAVTGSVEASDRIGQAWMILRTYAYDQDFVDSVLWKKIDAPVKYVQVTQLITKDKVRTFLFQPNVLTINAGESVYFSNAMILDGGRRIDINVTKPVNGVTKTWLSVSLADSIDVVFDEPADVAPGVSYPSFSAVTWGATSAQYNGTTVDPTGLGGNIPAWAGARWYTCPAANNELSCTLLGSTETPIRSRKFPVPGTYRYHSTLHPNASGTIIVR